MAVVLYFHGDAECDASRRKYSFHSVFSPGATYLAPASLAHDKRGDLSLYPRNTFKDASSILVLSSVERQACNLGRDNASLSTAPHKVLSFQFGI